MGIRIKFSFKINRQLIFQNNEKLFNHNLECNRALLCLQNFWRATQLTAVVLYVHMINWRNFYGFNTTFMHTQTAVEVNSPLSMKNCTKNFHLI